MDGFTQDQRILSISTPLGPDRLLLEVFEGAEEISKPFGFSATVRSLDDDLDPSSLIAQKVTVQLRLQDGLYRPFSGIVAAIDAGHAAAGGQRHYSLRIVPWLWFLTRTSDCRIFQGKTTLDILSEIFTEHGYRDFDFSRAGTVVSRDYCVQYRETDFDFVSRLLEEDGLYYYFQHEVGKHTMVVGSQVSAYQAKDEEPSIPFSAGSADTNHITEWHRRHAYQATAWALKDYNYQTSSLPLEQRTPTLSTYQQHPLHERFDYPGLHGDAAGGERRAKLAMQAEEVEREMISAAGDCRSLAPCGRFQLTGHPVESENGDYVVLSISHSAADMSYESAGGTTGYDNSLLCLPAATPYVPRRVTERPVIAGSQTAMVVGPEGQEIYTDAYGRVKVQFHWDRRGGSDERSSCWMRVAQSWGGGGFGAQVIPRVGMEVLVTFLEGNPDRPLVVGVVPNASTMPPLDLPGEATRTTMRSASSPGGGGFNLFTMEDKAGAEEMAFHSQKDLSMVVQNNSFEQIGQNKVIAAGALAAIKVGDSTIQVTEDSIEFVCSGSTIKMDKSGVTVNGQTIWLNPS
ncbi:type VI secretion system tip protein VgrG [Telmatospirillum sp.]|uniref:type VI secretion system Vgr family protein n=1 Tax=Telmatospirillum sp. TaxID=2079197 RepID=UPI00283E7A3B|nr:type VI secretion system tip protein VgrG [Telmatospirillum sp.]MDR3435267.1 type VI secretion system tip protein VgrG [Telmatospirillum sp.]